MQLKPEHKEYILKHEQDIRDNNWGKFFEYGKYPDGIGEPLYAAKLPFMLELGYVPERTFYMSTNITNIVIPNNVISMGYSALEGCTNLQSITLPFVGSRLRGTTNTHLGYIFGATNYSANNSCVPSSLKSVVITTANYIGDSAFSDCTGLTSISIPESVTKIGYLAFCNCTGLTNIEIPKNVRTIQAAAFSGCSNLATVKICANNIEIEDSAFSDLPTNLTIIYNGTKDEWKNIYNKYAFKHTYFTVNCTDGVIIKKRK